MKVHFSRRIIALTFVYLALCFTAIPNAYADTSQYQWNFTEGAYLYDTPDDACAALVARNESNPPTSCAGYYFGQSSVTFTTFPFVCNQIGCPYFPSAKSPLYSCLTPQSFKVEGFSVLAGPRFFCHREFAA